MFFGVASAKKGDDQVTVFWLEHTGGILFLDTVDLFY